MNGWDEMCSAMEEAKIRMDAADKCATQMAKMLDGRLRHVRNRFVLERLKKQLRDFNIKTGDWKE